MAWDPFEPIAGDPGAATRKKKPAMAENQYTPDTGPLPNLDPGKMSAGTPHVDAMAGYYPAGPWSPQTQAQFASRGLAPAPNDQPYSGKTGPEILSEPDAFQERGQQLQRRANGERSSADTAVENQEGAQLRGQLQASAQQSLAARGFAPSSALGLSYEKDVDRQVSELMERRRSEREGRAMSDLNTYFGQQEQRRGNLVNEQGASSIQSQGQQNYMAKMAEEQQRYEAEQAQAAAAKKQQQEWWRPSNWLNTISSLGQSAKNIGEGYKAVSTLPNPGTAGTPRRRT